MPTLGPFTHRVHIEVYPGDSFLKACILKPEVAFHLGAGISEALFQVQFLMPPVVLAVTVSHSESTTIIWGVPWECVFFPSVTFDFPADNSKTYSLKPWENIVVYHYNILIQPLIRHPCGLETALFELYKNKWQTKVAWPIEMLVSRQVLANLMNSTIVKPWHSKNEGEQGTDKNYSRRWMFLVFQLAKLWPRPCWLQVKINNIYIYI